MAPRRHHYLPRTYLQSFCGAEGKFWLQNRDATEPSIRTPVNTAVERDFYTINTTDGQRHDDIEEILSEVETHAGPIARKLDEGQTLSAEEDEWLAIFCGLFLVRTPRFHDWQAETLAQLHRKLAQISLGSPERAAATLARMQAALPDFDAKDTTPERLAEFITRGEYEIRIPREQTLMAMLEASVTAANALQDLDRFVIRTDGRRSFITSDAPFIIGRPAGLPAYMGAGILTPGAMKTLPLTQRTCVVYGDLGTRRLDITADTDLARSLNLITAVNSYQFIVGRDKPLVASIARAAGFGRKGQAAQPNESQSADSVVGGSRA